MQQRLPRRRVVLVLVAAASLRHPRRRRRRSRRRPRSSCSWRRCSSPKAATSTPSRPFSSALKSPDPPMLRAARAGVIQSALRVAEFDLGARRGREARQGRAARRRGASRCTATRCGRPGCSRRPRRDTATRWRSRPNCARGHHGMARSLAARSQLDEAMNEAQAALRLVAARPRDPPHGRRDLRADAQVRRGGRRVSATTSTCCRTRITARRPTGRAPKSGSCARSASACRSRWIRAPTTGLHGRLPPGERQGRRARQGQRRLARRTSSSTPARRTPSSRGRRRSASASRRSPTR